MLEARALGFLIHVLGVMSDRSIRFAWAVDAVSVRIEKRLDRLNRARPVASTEPSPAPPRADRDDPLDGPAPYTVIDHQIQLNPSPRSNGLDLPAMSAEDLARALERMGRREGAA